MAISIYKTLNNGRCFLLSPALSPALLLNSAHVQGCYVVYLFLMACDFGEFCCSQRRMAGAREPSYSAGEFAPCGHLFSRVSHMLPDYEVLLFE